MNDKRLRLLHPCPVCEREDLKALGHYSYRQLSMDDLVEHVMWCADPDTPLYHDEAVEPF